MKEYTLTPPILQYPTDLVFAVMGQNVLDSLTVLSTQSIQLADYHIHFAIIGESHCISVTHHDRLVLQEVLACTDIPAILQANSHKFAKLEPYQYCKKDYQARVWFRNRLEVDFDNDYDGELKLDFPEMFGQIPFTRIRWKSSDTQIEWYTVHVYPLETHTTYVFTQSYFELTERSNNE